MPDEPEPDPEPIPPANTHALSVTFSGGGFVSQGTAPNPPEQPEDQP